ncbi:MAG TPA: FGGY family carbohydrate kinase [Chitinophagaceae bacterium]|nr:FGGY family carbohydrate kinase [Chitinophagaceae bacterium]
MGATPVIAAIDLGRTNKKFFLFDKDYNVVHEVQSWFEDIEDEDGFPCENIDSILYSLQLQLQEVSTTQAFDIRAMNFSAHGAAFVYLDDAGHVLTPLYSYLKPYPETLKKKFYDDYGGEEKFASQTASPVLGSLNSGMQLYRMKYEKPEIFNRMRYALHLPQYLRFAVSEQFCSDITSIGCHTNLWDFEKHTYHEWVRKEGIASLLPPILAHNTVVPCSMEGYHFLVGPGLHDSSAALIPYRMRFTEPFVLISTGTWSISMNPFNTSPLSITELKHDCLCYLQYDGKPVKASRLFTGNIHDKGVDRIAAHFNKKHGKFLSVQFDPHIVEQLRNRSEANCRSTLEMIQSCAFEARDLSDFANHREAYHRLVMDIVDSQVASTQLVLENSNVQRIFVDGGFGKNAIYMNLLAAAFPNLQVYTATIAQAPALGAALSIHSAWNDRPLPEGVIELKRWGVGE